MTVAAHFVVKATHGYGPTVSAVRPKKVVTDSKPELAEDDEQDEYRGVEFRVRGLALYVCRSRSSC
ncbi:hypothetical protein [Haloarcula pellucida]|uniref:hypothetical protein n=1 Tax=Haloarcula pellucida TaxID=1427151 RepID=UPI00166C43F3|nr:hypothetical protein [Halomicroarcula pellucida]MBX0350006.1 hypothetical protein [Halomicroarcula pellucida]